MDLCICINQIHIGRGPIIIDSREKNLTKKNRYTYSIIMKDLQKNKKSNKSNAV